MNGTADSGGLAQIVFRHPNYPTVADNVNRLDSNTNGGSQGDDAIVTWSRVNNQIRGITGVGGDVAWTRNIPWLDVTGVKFIVNASGGIARSASGMQYQ